MDMGVSDDYLRNAAAAANNSSVADQIREATLEHIWRQLREDVAPSVLFQVDEALGFPGTQDDPVRAIAGATHDAVRDAILDAHDRGLVTGRHGSRLGRRTGPRGSQ